MVDFGNVYVYSTEKCESSVNKDTSMIVRRRNTRLGYFAVDFSQAKNLISRTVIVNFFLVELMTSSHRWTNRLGKVTSLTSELTVHIRKLEIF